MFSILLYIIEVKKEVLIGISLSILYITYYLVEVVKKPTLICRNGKFREVLEQEVPVLGEHYWPTPWCVESRLQTVLGSLIRTHLLPSVQYRREVLRLSDGGQVALDWLEAESAGGVESSAVPTLVVLPGLTGASHADYVRCLAVAARSLGAHTCVFNNRGNGGLPLSTPRLYCALSHGDLAEVVAHVKLRGGPVLAAGVSLGGLILGQHLAAAGDASGVAAALIVSSPLDVEAGAACMESTLNAPLSYHMARALRRTVTAHAALHFQRPTWDWAEVLSSRSLRQFDAAFTTKHFGFGSVDAYYRKATLRDKLHLVRTPLLCLCAADDPFQPADVIPCAEVGRADRVALAVTARGGHIGFLEGWWPAHAPHTQYIARLAAQYFAALLRNPDLLLQAPTTPTLTS